MERGSGRDRRYCRRWRMAILILEPIAYAGAGGYLLSFGFGPPWNVDRREAVVQIKPPAVPGLPNSRGIDPIVREERLQLLLTTNRVVRLARQDDVWQSVGRRPDEARIELAAEGRDRVRVRSRSSDEGAAAAGVTATLHTFTVVVWEDHRTRDMQEIAELGNEIAALQEEIERVSREEASERGFRLAPALRTSLFSRREQLQAIRSRPIPRASIWLVGGARSVEQPSATATSLGRKLLVGAGLWSLSFLVLLAMEARHAAVFRRRVRLGVCTRCGYDLRASPIACPECGTPRVVPSSTGPV